MARGDDNTLLLVGAAAAAGYLFLTPGGKAHWASFTAGLKAAPTTDPNKGTGTVLNSGSGATAPAASVFPPATKPAASSDQHDASVWTGWRDGSTEQVWVRNATTGEWRYVVRPEDFSTYAIAENTLHYVSPGTEKAFDQNGYIDGSQHPAQAYFLRSDTPNGLSTDAPSGPAVADLGALYRGGDIRPHGVVGLAQLKKYGII